VTRRLALLLALAGCRGNTEIDITLTIGPNVQAALFDKLVIAVSGAESYTTSVSLDPHSFDGGQARLTYVPGVHSGTLNVQLSAHSNGVTVAFGQAMSVKVRDGAAVPVAVELDCGGSILCSAPIGDMSVPDGSVPDLVGADLAHGAPDGAIVYASFDNNFSGWNPLTPNGTAEIDTSFHHTGAGSLHLRLPPFGVDGGGYSQAYVIRSGVAIPDPFWVSAWVSYGANAAAYGSVGLIGMRDPSNNIVGVNEDALVVRAIANGETGFTDWSSGGVFATQPSWTCLVFRAQSGASGSVTLTVDGTDYNNPEPYTLAMPLTQVWLGIDSTPIDGEPLEVWLDEVTVANHPIGCN
jgi:hypothetical protein